VLRLLAKGGQMYGKDKTDETEVKIKRPINPKRKANNCIGKKGSSRHRQRLGGKSRLVWM
jgi:hypothetical protein